MLDVANRLAAWRDPSPTEWFNAINRRLPSGVAATFVIAIAYQLATITWTLAPGAAPAVTLAARGESALSAAVDASVLIDSHLFGEGSAQTISGVPAVIDAPDTTLRLTLTGILAEERDMSGKATISSNQDGGRNYEVGQSIEGVDGTTLHSIHADRVVLRRNGQFETLRFPNGPSAGGPSMGQRLFSSQADAVSGSLREAVTENVTRLSAIVRLAPHVQEGRVVGFRLNPGPDRAAFDALGLQPGDIITDINGIPLDDRRQGPVVLESLGESTQANVTILRDGIPQLISIDTRQVQSPPENRE